MSSLIKERFLANLGRANGLVTLYVQVAGATKGRPTVAESDLLRASVVQLQAALEDLLRAIASGRLASVGTRALGQIPLPVGTGRKRRFTLADLDGYRGLSVNELIERAVGAFLGRSTFGNLNKVVRILAAVGLRPPQDKAIRARVAAMMARRHHIGHRLDRNEMIGRGHHQARSISKKTVEVWIDAVEAFGEDILSQIRTGRAREDAAMTEYERFSEKLSRAIAAEGCDAKVSAGKGDFGKILFFVSAPGFEGMDESDRQEIVWRAILDQFSPAEQDRVEFIYTDAPSELANVPDP